MNLITCFLVCMLIFVNILSPKKVQASPKKEVRYNYYNIYPNTRQQIEFELADRSPLSSGTVALTHADVRWRYEVTKNQGVCELTSIQTEVLITYTLPTIPYRHKAANRVYTAFDKYFSALMRHEEEHARLFYQAGVAIEEYLNNMKEYSGICTYMDRKASKEAEYILSDFRQRNREFDLRTKHGRTQGVTLNYYSD